MIFSIVTVVYCLFVYKTIHSGATYFFKGVNFWKFDNARMHTHNDYPKLIQDYWFKTFKCDSYNGNQVYNLELRTTNGSFSSASLSLFIAINFALMALCDIWTRSWR